MEQENQQEENKKIQKSGSQNKADKGYTPDSGNIHLTGQFVNRDEKSDTSFMVVKDGVPVNINELDDAQKAELTKLIKSFSIIKGCIQAIISNDILAASEFIRSFAEARDTGSLEVVFHFARENAERLSFGMGMMINGCINELSGNRAKEEAISLLEGKGGDLSL